MDIDRQDFPEGHNWLQYTQELLDLWYHSDDETYRHRLVSALHYAASMAHKQVFETTNIYYDLTEVMWITVNPQPDITLSAGLKQIEKFLQKTLITDYIYVVEQRGLTLETAGNGFHFHILHKHKYSKKSLYDRETRNTFKKICLADKFSIVKITSCKTDQDVKKRLEYILGTKRDEDGLNKDQKQKIDLIFREKEKLQQYYTNNLAIWKEYE